MKAVLIALALLAVAPDTSLRRDTADFYPIRTGMTWVTTYGCSSEMTTTVVGREVVNGRPCWKLETTYKNKPNYVYRQWVEKDAGGIRMVKYEVNGKTTKYKKPLPLFVTPRRGRRVFKWKGTYGNSTTMEIEDEYLGIENVTFEGRSYPCMKIRRKYNYSGMKYTAVRWYGRGIGLMKSITKYESMDLAESESTLKKFSLKPLKR